VDSALEGFANQMRGDPMSSFDPVPPSAHHAPLRLGPDTWLIRQLQGEGSAPMAVYINSLVIAGAEPVIVDTGTRSNRWQWLDDVFSIVAPDDVRWVFLSHDDTDHTGNLTQVLDACPNATLVTNWFSVERMATEVGLPLDRMRWVDDGERFDAGDRELVALRPPLFDSPTTRGLLDTGTGFYWASDAFGAPVTAPADQVADLDQEFWRESFSMMNLTLSPWLSWVDASRWIGQVDRLRAADLTAIATAHGPLLTGAHIGQALDLTAALPGQDPVPLPGQAVLDGMLQALAAA
jgi:flavorubredoxin